MKTKLLILNINEKLHVYEFFNGETSRSRIDETIKRILNDLNYEYKDNIYNDIYYVIKEINIKNTWQRYKISFNCDLN